MSTKTHTPSNTLNLTAVYDMFTGSDETFPQMVEFDATFATLEEAEALANRLPKAARLLPQEVPSIYGPNFFQVYVRINLHPNRSTGAVNESGIRRVAQIQRAADWAGIRINYDKRYGNSFSTYEAFMVALARYAASN